MERSFQIVAVVLAGVAAFFYWRDDGDWAFAAAVLALCAFFLSIRFQIKKRNRLRDMERAGIEMDDKDDVETSHTSVP